MTLSAEMTASLTSLEQNNSLTKAIHEFNTTCDELAAAFNTIAQIFSVAFEDWNTAVTKIVTECLDSIDIFTPREKLPRPPQKILNKYSYIPTRKKHLPYQRRNY